MIKSPPTIVVLQEKKESDDHKANPNNDDGMNGGNKKDDDKKSNKENKSSGTAGDRSTNSDANDTKNSNSSSGKGLNQNKEAIDSKVSNDKVKNNKTSPPKELENECISCCGLTYFNSKLKDQKKPPMCIGYKSKSKLLIPAERMRTLDRLPPIKENTQIFQIGISQASVKMNHSGKVPVLIFGVEIISEDIQEDTKQNINPTNKNIQSKHNDSKKENKAESYEIFPYSYIGSLYPVSWQLINKQVERASTMVSEFTSSYIRSCKKQFHGMGNLYIQISTDLPSKLQRSAQRLSSSAQKRWKNLTRSILEMILGTPSK